MTCEAIIQYALFVLDAEGNRVAEKIKATSCTYPEYWVLDMTCQCGHTNRRAVCLEHGQDVLNAKCRVCTDEIADQHICSVTSVQVLMAGGESF